MIITFIILGITIALFIWGKVRSDLVALVSLLALFLANILTLDQALAGFSDSTVIMIAALFVVGEGLSRTGVTAWLGSKIIALAGSSKGRLLVVLMLGTAVMSAFISNTGTVATLLPATVTAAWSIGGLPSQFLMPLAFAANTGGMLTLTGTPPNIVVSDILTNAGFAPFGYFEYALIGLPLLATAVLYMAVVGRRLLPQRKVSERPVEVGVAIQEMADAFALPETLFVVPIRRNEKLVGHTLEVLALGHDYNLSVLRIESESEAGSLPSDRRERRRLRIEHFMEQLREGDTVPGPATIVKPHDVLLVRGAIQDIDRAAKALDLQYDQAQITGDTLSEVLLSQEVGVAEVLLAPRSTYIGRTVTGGKIAIRYSVQVLAIRRGKKSLGPQGTKLAFGDALLVRGSWSAINAMRSEARNFVVVGDPDELSRQIVETTRPAVIAVLALAGMVVLMVTGLVPTVIAAVLAAVVMVLGGCLTPVQAYRAISWQSVVLIAAMIPMSIALNVTGGTELIATGLVNTLGSIGPLALLAGIFLLTTGFSQVINNTATAVLVAPIVLQAALELNLSPYPFLMVVAVSASTAFLTPIGTTTNLMVMTPGGYRFTDYARVGGPLILMFLALTLILVPIIWPF